MGQIFETDTSFAIAHKIFEEFTVGESCTVRGVEQIVKDGRDTIAPKWELVRDSY